jgi:23S rRNA (uracil1939-C5)-methyltransferase
MVYSIGDELEVRVEKIVPRGYGLAFADKLTVLVPLAAPGDVLRVQIREVKKRLAFAEIVEIISPGPDRAVPPCMYFGTCGGCDFQQLNYEAQLAAKLGIISDCLRRIAKIDYDGEIPIIPSPPLSYRSRARWHADGDTLALGYFKRDSHDVVDVAACPILVPSMQSTLEFVRENTDWKAMPQGRSELEAATGGDGEVSMFSYDDGSEAAELSFTLNDDRYAYSARTFFQANKLLIGDLVHAATSNATGSIAFDLYAGVGLFSLPLGRQFKQVIVVEGNSTAAAFAKQNVLSAGLDNVKVSNKSVDNFLIQNKTKNIDFVLIDPPRSGTEKRTIEAITSLKPKQISYVSCEPSILARDLPVFIGAGYAIDSITALDLFPQTHHVETVARLHLT